MEFRNAVFSRSAGRADQFPRDLLPQVAFSGRSNVGKSSLLNKLVGFRALARVSSEPGKTITVNFFTIDKRFYLVDLPGYGYARRSAEGQREWSKIADAYFQENPSLCLVLQLVDLKVGPTKDDLTMLDFLQRRDIPYFILATKADKLNKTEREKALSDLPARCACDPSLLVPCSSKTGEGIEETRKRILASLRFG